MATGKKSKQAQGPKVGDLVLAYGHVLKVWSVEDDVVHVNNRDAEAIAAARKEINTLREEQVTLTKNDGARHEEIHSRITELSEFGGKVDVKLSLRLDLLSWWEEEGMWTREGGMLSDAQVKAWQEATGSQGKPAPDQHRAARTMLKKLDLLVDPVARVVYPER